MPEQQQKKYKRKSWRKTHTRQYQSGLIGPVIGHPMTVREKLSKRLSSILATNNKQYMLGDFDDDGIKNIDDKFPFIPSDETVEETKLSDAVEKVNDIHDENIILSKEIVDEFKHFIKNERGDENIKNVQSRVKAPISTLNKAIDKGIPEIWDFIGIRYLGTDYEDLKQLSVNMKQKYNVIPDSFKDYYLNPKKGYKGIHFTFIDPQTDSKIEVQFQTERIGKVALINHYLYKHGNQNDEKFSSLIDTAEHADNGQKWAIKYFDSLTKQQIQNILTQKNK